MGTRADFYIGRGDKAEWLGSIAWDGHPDSIEASVRQSKTEPEFRAALAAFVKNRNDWTPPAKGWPWPWEDSRTTDYAYAFDEGKVWGSCFGREWFDAGPGIDTTPEDAEKEVMFPNMKAIQKVTFGKRSGTITIGPAGIDESE